ncbi:hypothetical protein NPIL_152371 [Nephila pilipes]|uniref:Uncharacterized protein n=1 Tax=Nephila pilipes TaxID=299642 RepID=A0A8X6P0S8_NEPPI|nr:hypothetical protein NPIL_152371 [Nephila pilipes]
MHERKKYFYFVKQRSNSSSSILNFSVASRNDATARQYFKNYNLKGCLLENPFHTVWELERKLLKAWQLLGGTSQGQYSGQSLVEFLHRGKTEVKGLSRGPMRLKMKSGNYVRVCRNNWNLTPHFDVTNRTQATPNIGKKARGITGKELIADLQGFRPVIGSRICT